MKLLNRLNHTKTKGSALITALLITAIAAAIAAVIASQESIAIRQTQLTTNAQQGYYDAQGVIDWASDVLIIDLKNQINKQPAILFPKTLKVDNKFYGARVQGQINDANAVFNINALMNGNIQPQFVRLVQAVDPQITTNAAYAIANNISNWLRPSNADELYLRYKPPYRASHTRMASISELRLVAGVTRSLYLKLAPYITALPNSTNSINILDAPLPVIMSLGQGITVDQAKAIQECQANVRGNQNAQQLFQNCIANLKIKLDPTVNVTFTSNFFTVNAYVLLSNQWVRLQTLLEREYESSDSSQQQDDNSNDKQQSQATIVIKQISQSFE